MDVCVWLSYNLRIVDVECMLKFILIKLNKLLKGNKLLIIYGEKDFGYWYLKLKIFLVFWICFNIWWEFIFIFDYKYFKG